MGILCKISLTKTCLLFLGCVFVEYEMKIIVELAFAVHPSLSSGLLATLIFCKSSKGIQV